MNRRQEKMNDLVREVLSEIVQREVKDPRLGFLSLTGVEVAPDLSSARVFVSVMGDDTQQKDYLAVLQRARGFLRTELARRIRTLRHTPELIFKLDTSIQQGVRVYELLEQVKREDAEKAVPESSERSEVPEQPESPERPEVPERPEAPERSEDPVNLPTNSAGTRE